MIDRNQHDFLLLSPTQTSSTTQVVFLFSHIMQIRFCFTLLEDKTKTSKTENFTSDFNKENLHIFSERKFHWNMDKKKIIETYIHFKRESHSISSIL